MELSYNNKRCFNIRKKKKKNYEKISIDVVARVYFVASIIALILFDYAIYNGYGTADKFCWWFLLIMAGIPLNIVIPIILYFGEKSFKEIW